MDVEEDVELIDGDGDGDAPVPRQKPSKRKVSPSQRGLIMDLLKARHKSGEYRMNCAQVIEHLEYYHPSLASVSMHSARLEEEGHAMLCFDQVAGLCYP